MQELNIKSELNFDLICRTCLEQKNEETNCIYDMDVATNTSFLEMLSAFINMQINDKLPQKICNICSNLIRNAYNFKCRVEQYEKYLLTYLNENVIDETKLEPKFKVLIKTEVLEDNDLGRGDTDNKNEVFKTNPECFTLIHSGTGNNKTVSKTIKKKVLPSKVDIVEDILKIEEENLNSVENKTTSSISSVKTKVRKKRVKDEFKIIQNNFECEVCHKAFNIQSRLKKHMVKHEPNNKKFECEVCHKKFTQRDSMKTHFKKFHDATYVPKPIKYDSKQLCTYCGKKVYGLTVHVRRHTGERPYKCDICGKGFAGGTELNYHRRSHTGERPHLCVICGKGFAKSDKLKNHIRIHTGERPYKCTYCDQAFIQSKDLKNHIRRHTDEKPYECGDCGKRFIQKTALRTHCKSQGHNIEKQIQNIVKIDPVIQLPSNVLGF